MVGSINGVLHGILDGDWDLEGKSAAFEYFVMGPQHARENGRVKAGWNPKRESKKVMPECATTKW